MDSQRTPHLSSPEQPGLTWNSSVLATSTWPSSHWCRRCPPAPHTASWPRGLLRSTLSSPLSEIGPGGGGEVPDPS